MLPVPDTAPTEIERTTAEFVNTPEDLPYGLPTMPPALEQELPPISPVL